MWCWRRLLNPLDCKEIKPVNPKGNQPWIFIGRTDAEVSILWPPDVKNWLIGKDPDAGKDWRWEEEMPEDEMVGWHHKLNWHELEQALGVGDGQGSLVCCSPWGCKESDMNWVTKLNWLLFKDILLNTITLKDNILLCLSIDSWDPRCWLISQRRYRWFTR